MGRSAISLLAVGLALVAVNLAGFLVPLRAPDVTGYADFAGAPTLSFEQSNARLEALKSLPRKDMATEATRIFHEGLAHIAPADVEARGFDHYRMRVPPTENWVLYLLSFVKPDTYRDYEFCHYRRVLERGTGRCGQASLSLVSFLSQQGLNTGFVALGGHAIATAEVDDGLWYLLDADYGGVMPFDLAQAEADPETVLPHYWSPAAARNGLHHAYGEDRNEIKLGGPEARFGRACFIEPLSYVAKWTVPAILIGFALLAQRFRR